MKLPYMRVKTKHACICDYNVRSNRLFFKKSTLSGDLDQWYKGLPGKCRSQP